MRSCGRSDLSLGQLATLLVIAKAGLVRRIGTSGASADLDPSTLTRNLSCRTTTRIQEVANSSARGRADPVRSPHREGRAIIKRPPQPRGRKARQRASRKTWPRAGRGAHQIFRAHGADASSADPSAPLFVHLFARRKCVRVSFRKERTGASSEGPAAGRPPSSPRANMSIRYEKSGNGPLPRAPAHDPTQLEYFLPLSRSPLPQAHGYAVDLPGHGLAISLDPAATPDEPYLRDAIATFIKRLDLRDVTLRKRSAGPVIAPSPSPSWRRLAGRVRAALRAQSYGHYETRSGDGIRRGNLFANVIVAALCRSPCSEPSSRQLENRAILAGRHGPMDTTMPAIYPPIS